MKKKKPVSLRTWLTQKLRRLSMQWPNRNEAKKLARVSRGRYLCAGCGAIVKDKETRMDHINPVVAIDGFKTWDEYLNTLFCEIENFQLLCITCHDNKTKKENEQR